MGEVLVSVLFNGFWIVGLAVILAALSYHHYLARMNERTLRQQLASRSFALAAWSGAVLLAVGLAGTSAMTWETLVWIVLALYATYAVARTWRQGSALNVDTTSSST